MRVIARALKDIVEDIWIRLVLGVVRLVPGRPGNPLTEPVRCALLGLLGMALGPGCQVSPDFLLFRMGAFRAGAGCRFGYNFQVWNFAALQIGDRLLASHGVKVICGTHRVSAKREDVAGPVTIGDDVWLGADITIVGPCEIGDRVIVGANSFVSGKLEPGWIYAGSPARPIRAVSETTKGRS